jgi:hypothetical protein
MIQCETRTVFHIESLFFVMLKNLDSSAAKKKTVDRDGFLWLAFCVIWLNFANLLFFVVFKSENKKSSPLLLDEGELKINLGPKTERKKSLAFPFLAFRSTQPTTTIVCYSMDSMGGSERTRTKWRRRVIVLRVRNLKSPLFSHSLTHSCHYHLLLLNLHIATNEERKFIIIAVVFNSLYQQI